MEDNFGERFHPPDLEPPDFSTLSSPLNPGQPNSYTAPMTAGSNAFPVGEIIPGSSAAPHCKGFGTNNPPHGWFYCLPRFRQNFNAPNPSPNKEIFNSPSAKPEETLSPNPKTFIVFDQSGGQTTMIYSSGIKTTVPCLTSLVPKVDCVDAVNEIELNTRRDSVQYPDPVITHEVDHQREDLGTEMHEDTDEINALLYSSDDEDYSENEEEASTGHSPCVITANDKQQSFHETEEVASSFGHAKRLKLTNGGYDMPSLHGNASSVNLRKCFDYEDDAESSCYVRRNDKRSKKDKIRETVSILQKILPAGKGKDTIMILDEAIGYLKSLKHKALDLGVEIL